MSKYIPGNQKHLAMREHAFIENSLNQNYTYKDIAKYLCKDPTTISKEVKARRSSDWYHKGTFYNAKNFCIHRFSCRKVNVCKWILVCGVKWASCPTCNQTCRDFVKERCSLLDKAPYVSMAATRRSLTAPLLTNTHTMHGLLTASIMSYSTIPEQVSA